MTCIVLTGYTLMMMEVGVLALEVVFFRAYLRVSKNINIVTKINSPVIAMRAHPKMSMARKIKTKTFTNNVLKKVCTETRTIF